MMQLICNGEPLDLKRGESVALKKTNPLFAFDSLSCERTTELSLPDTPNNNRILALSKDPAFYGDGMRRRYDAQMVDGLVSKAGYLYVTRYSNGEYKSVFVTGEMLGMMKLKVLGKLKEVASFTDYTQFGVLSTNAASLWNTIRYHQDGGVMHPSIRLRALIDSILSQRGLPAITVPSAVDYMRIIPSEVKTIDKIVDIESHVTDPYQPTADDPEKELNSMTYSEEALFTTQDAIVDIVLLNRTRTFNVCSLVAQQDLVVSFGDGFSDKLFIVAWDVEYGARNFLGEFIGNWAFTKSWDYTHNRTIVEHTGTPLAGRSVEIPKGTAFLILNEDWFIYNVTQSSSTTYTDRGWDLREDNFSMDYSLKIKSKELSVGDNVLLQDNLPDVTLVDLLKTIAALTGKVLNYTDSDGVTFDDLVFDEWSVIELDDYLMKMDEVARRFGDYANRNIIQFNSDDAILAAQRISVEYRVDNDNIQESKVLQQIPFSEGAEVYSNGYLIVSVPADAKNDTIADAEGEESQYGMVRVSLPLNDGLIELCDASTSIVASFHMSQYQFDKITAKTKILLRGQLYAWTDAQWSKGIAKFYLSKI